MSARACYAAFAVTGVLVAFAPHSVAYEKSDALLAMILLVLCIRFTAEPEVRS